MPLPDKLNIRDNDEICRRKAMQLTGAVGVAMLLPLPWDQWAQASPSSMQAEIARITGGANVKPGRVKLDIPPLVENGNTVPCTVTVESPMTPADHVKWIYVFNEKNPQPHVISCRLGPRAGKASFSTRIRLSDTQDIIAIAQMSDGSFWSDTANVLITLGACLEDPI